MELEEIKKIVKEILSEKRYNHCVGVMQRSVELAKKFGADEDICAKIGLAHDIAKEISEENKIKYCEENNIEIDEIERINPSLLHAKIGKDIAIKKLGFNESMAEAIANHTTGNKNMDLYSKILFIADRTSVDRNFEDLEYLKTLEDKGINEAVLYILDKKLEQQIKKQNPIHLNGIIARNSLLEEMKNN